MRVAAAGLLLTGCFYIDPIVAPPEVEIVNTTAVMERDGQVTLTARFTNRDEQVGSFHWELFACADYAGGVGDNCESVPWIRRDVQEFTADIPAQTHMGGPLAAAAWIRLEARDGIGARATDKRYYELLDAPPALEVKPGASSGVWPVGAPIDLFARYSDPDSAIEDVVLTWIATPPTTQQAVAWEDPSSAAVDGATPPHATVSRRLIPGEPGPWHVDVVATSHGKTAQTSVSLDVEPNRPPCLALWQPSVPPVGAALPITAPTLFEILRVDDDVDAYPPRQGAAQYGTPRFAWSILRPDAPGRQILDGATGNQLELDPAVFTPGDVVELRVEVFDDEHDAPLPCDDREPTCALPQRCQDPNQTSLQRQTWRVEIR